MRAILCDDCEKIMDNISEIRIITCTTAPSGHKSSEAV